MYIGYCDENGFLRLPRERIKEEIKDRFSNRNIKMVISPYSGDKSLEQLGYYYGVILPYAMYGLIQLGNRLQLDNDEDCDDVDQMLKDKFLKNGIDIVDVHGEAHKAPSSLSRADKQETSEFVEWVIQWLSENLHVVIPEADKDWKNKGDAVKQKLLEKLYGI